MQKDSAYAWHVHLNNCDNRCLIVLANVITDAGYKWVPDEEIIESVYKRIEITSISDKRDLQRYDFSIAGFEFKERHYPQFAEILRPLVTFEGTASIKTFRRVIIEFHTPSAEARFDQINELGNLWGKVIRNGYPRSLEDLYTENSAIQDISVDLFDENSLEIKVETFGGSEAAWNSLINILGPIRSEMSSVKIY